MKQWQHLGHVTTKRAVTEPTSTLVRCLQIGKDADSEGTNEQRQDRMQLGDQLPARALRAVLLILAQSEAKEARGFSLKCPTLDAQDDV